MNFEILAPVGSMESLIAGVRSGADAVYLGGKSFNARRNAGNFNDEELKRAVNYCHCRGVKVYLTFNILVCDSEFESAYNAVKSALEAGVDAFIIQDLGVAEMIKECFPQARLHASTQTSVMTPSGVRALTELGFSRVVLPREMSLDEINEIKKSCDCELEVFVHGALCMSVSGQCYLSSVIGSRSGNRGLCAQPCRLPFSAGGERTHALSLKDLSLIRHLKELDGITSLKIEGRMKRPEYVAAAVTAVKKAIDGEYTDDDERILKSVFSRSGFTDGYFLSKLGGNMFGTRQKEDVTAAAGVLKSIRKTYEKEAALVAVNMDFTCNSDKCTLEAKALGKKVCVTGEKPQKAVNKPTTRDMVFKQLTKLGSTQYYPENIKIDISDGLAVAVSQINKMRREAIAELEKSKPPQVISKPFENIEIMRRESTTPYATAVFADASQIPDKTPFKRIFIPADSSFEAFIDNRAGVVMPRGMFNMENKLKKRLEELKKAGVTKALCGNIGSYRLARELGFDVYGDWPLNIFNSKSANMIKSPILSFELTLDRINKTNAGDIGMIAYGRLPLMLTRNCPVKSDIACAECGKKGALIDRKGKRFPILCSAYPCVELLNCVPVYMLDRIDEIKTDFIHFIFTTESKDEVEKIINLYERNEKYDGDFTRALYYRSVL